MKRGTPGHPKTLTLADELEIAIPHAVGILEMLWHYTGDYTPRGDIGKVSNKTIARAVGWSGDSEKLIQVLISSGWLDVSADHRLIIHDWPEHAEELVRKRLERMEGGGGFLPEYGTVGVRRVVAENGGQCPTKAASRGARLGKDMDVAPADSSEEGLGETRRDQLQKIFFSRYKQTRGAKLDAKKQDKARTTSWLEEHKDTPDEILAALELFLADEYWAGPGFPLAAFRKQYEKYRNPEPVGADEDADEDLSQEAVVVAEPPQDAVKNFLLGTDARFQHYCTIFYIHGKELLLPKLKLAHTKWLGLTEAQREGAISHAGRNFPQWKLHPAPLGHLESEPWTSARMERVVPMPVDHRRSGRSAASEAGREMYYRDHPNERPAV